MALPSLYAILDGESLRRRGIGLREFACGLRDGGCTLVQYRDKTAGDDEILRNAAVIEEVFASVPDVHLVMNDRVDLMLVARWNGVHLGQEDGLAADARVIAGDGRLIGVSTHTEEQVRRAAASVADYVAIGPVFATGTKADASPVVGLDGVRAARALTAKPLVAIGGINRVNAASVREAGADSIAVIGDLLDPAEPVERIVRDFLRLLR